MIKPENHQQPDVKPTGSEEQEESQTKLDQDENPNQLDDPDDLHEIKAGDSLGEPDPEGYDDPNDH